LFAKGDTDAGKSRFLKVAARLAYKKFRMSGAGLFSSNFRLIDGNGGTLVMDEAQHNAGDPTSEPHRLLAQGNERGASIKRQEQSGSHEEYHTRDFAIYCPKIFAGRFASDEDAIRSRTLEVLMKGISGSEFEKYDKMDSEWEKRAEALVNNLLL